MACISLDTSTFGKSSECVLKKVCNGKPTGVVLVFDNYVSPSIRDVERNNRNADRNLKKIQIVEHIQVRPSDLNTVLKSYSFKESLVDYLVKS